jgi:hypothetical protein
MADRKVLSSAVLVVSALFCGCAETVPLTNRDVCGLQGMELKGVNLSSAEARGVHRIGGIFDDDTIVSHASATGREVRCEVPPESSDRICKVNAYKARALFKGSHDAFTVDGLDELEKKASDVWQLAYSACMANAEEEARAAAQRSRPARPSHRAQRITFPGADSPPAAPPPEPPQTPGTLDDRGPSPAAPPPNPPSTPTKWGDPFVDQPQ